MTEHHADPAGEEALARAYRASIADAPGPHPTEDDWVALASDAVPDERRAALADHIARCAACADTWRAVSEVRDGASSFDAAAPRVAPAARPRALGRWVGLGAAAVLALAVATTLRQAPSREATPADPTATSPSASPAPSAAVETAPSPRDWAALPDAPDVVLPPALTLTVRGATTERDMFLAAFGPAIAPYREARYADAATALAPLTERFTAIPEVWFYLGVSRLLDGHPAEALPALTRATASDVVGPQAVWLRIVALERAGRADEATAALRASCAAATFDAHRAACRALPPAP